MDYDISYLTILLFFIPGLILSKLDLFYGADRRANYLNQFYNVLIAGAVTYGIVGLGYWVLKVDFSIPFEVLLGFPEGAVETTREYMGKAISADNPLYHWTVGKEEVSIKVVTLADCLDEIAWAFGISYVVAMVWLKGVKHKVVMRHLHLLRVTDKSGEYDVWTDVFTSSNGSKEYTVEELKKLRYVRVWNYKRKLLYCGWVLRFSEYDNFRELSLIEVKVYRFNEEFDIFGPILNQSHIYLAFANDDVWIEFPITKKE